MKLFQYPTKFYHITQKFGANSRNYGSKGHRGLDLRIKNDPHRGIYAARDGKVIFVDTRSDWNWYRPSSWGRGSSYGNHVIIEHIIDGVKYYTLYAHMLEPYVKKGQLIKTGQLLGKGGNTGLSTAEHLHFEVRKGGNSSKYAVDPTDLLTEKLADEDDFEVPDWADEAVTWVRANDLFQITNQKDVRDAVKFHRLFKLITGK